MTYIFHQHQKTSGGSSTFHKLQFGKGDNETVEMERKCFANDSLAGFSDLSTSEESRSHYHITLLLREIRVQEGPRP